MLRATASPRPVRCWSSLVVKNGSKICGRTSGGMPLPVSRTRMRTALAVGIDSVATVEPPALGHGFGGVHQQHQNDLLDLAASHIDRRQRPRRDAAPARCPATRACAAPARRRARTTVFRSLALAVAGRLAREGQQVLHQVAAAPALPLDGAKLLGHLVLGRQARCFSTSAQDQPRVGQDAEQRVVDLMRHGGRQLADGRQLLAAQQRLVRALQLRRLPAHALFDLAPARRPPPRSSC